MLELHVCANRTGMNIPLCVYISVVFSNIAILNTVFLLMLLICMIYFSIYECSKQFNVMYFAFQFPNERLSIVMFLIFIDLQVECPN